MIMLSIVLTLHYLIKISTVQWLEVSDVVFTTPSTGTWGWDSCTDEDAGPAPVWCTATASPAAATTSPWKPSRGSWWSRGRWTRGCWGPGRRVCTRRWAPAWTPGQPPPPGTRHLRREDRYHPRRASQLLWSQGLHGQTPTPTFARPDENLNYTEVIDDIFYRVLWWEVIKQMYRIKENSFLCSIVSYPCQVCEAREKASLLFSNSDRCNVGVQTSRHSAFSTVQSHHHQWSRDFVFPRNRMKEKLSLDWASEWG